MNHQALSQNGRTSVEAPHRNGLTLETRWISGGEIPPSILESFRSLGCHSEVREDLYLISPHLSGISMKVRGDEAFEVKLRRGRAGLFTAAGAQGRCELWQKWSFPLLTTRSGIGDTGDPRTWWPVAKSRLIVEVPGEDGAVCHAELTQILVRNRAWWTFGLEASGPLLDLSDQLTRAGGRLISQLPPTSGEFSNENCSSYADWLQGWLLSCRREARLEGLQGRISSHST